MMEKRGVIEAGRTPEEGRPFDRRVQKQAANKALRQVDEAHTSTRATARLREQFSSATAAQ